MSDVAPRKWIELGFSDDPQPLARFLSRAWLEWNRAQRAKRKQVKRQRIIARDGMTCGICAGAIATLADLHIDHIVPVALGGTSDPSNLQPAHALCNMKKGAR